MFCRKSILIILFISFSLIWTSEVKEDHLLLLDEATFESALQNKDVMLVLFQSNQCQSCSELQAKMSAAAALLFDSTGSEAPPPRAGLARVNSTASPSLAAQYGIDPNLATPVLKLFKLASSSAAASDYTGPTDTAEAIAEHIRLQAEADSGPQRLTEANLTDALSRQANWLVAFVDAASSSRLDFALEGLKSAADQLRRGKHPVAFGYADARGNEEALAKRLGLSTDSLPVFALLQRDEPSWAIPFSHELNGANLAKFVRAHVVESIAQLRAEAAQIHDSPEPLDALNGGVDAHLVASEAAAAPVRRFLAAFLAESGFFFDRRLDGGLLAAPAAKKLGMTLDAIYVRLSPHLLTSGESGMARYPGPLHSSPSLKTFFDRRSLPRLGLLAWHTRRAYMSAPGRSVCLFYTSLPGNWLGESGKLAKRTHAKLAAMIEGRQQLALFALAGEEQQSTEVANFGFDESSSEVNLGCYDAARRRFAMPESDGPDPAAVHKFLDSFAAGTALQRLRSASVPLADNVEVATANAERLAQLLKDAARVLLIQCDFSTQPCGQSIKEFAAAASEFLSNRNNKNIRFVRVDTKFNDLPGELYYRFEGESAIELTSEQPQVMLLLPSAGLQSSGQAKVIRYERDAVAKAYLLQFLTDNSEFADRAAHQEL
ncbi:hypothetical protein BOX15_Mlig002726g3 [Macrostomum lignano]|uniref:protein disulfide-isomerase n=1 Tax=Macrostomum lignano TaxID=282301 RepID=A0A267GV54_9PLAT|nr:hypothetical protein BOX15_Mlig002726g3 [Macrostomum lignano]